MHDKSRPAHQSKKPPGKTLKEKRAEKQAAHPKAPISVVPPRKPRSHQ